MFGAVNEFRFGFVGRRHRSAAGDVAATDATHAALRRQGGRLYNPSRRLDDDLPTVSVRMDGGR